MKDDYLKELSCDLNNIQEARKIPTRRAEKMVRSLGKTIENDLVKIGRAVESYATRKRANATAAAIKYIRENDSELYKQLQHL